MSVTFKRQQSGKRGPLPPGWDAESNVAPEKKVFTAEPESGLDEGWEIIHLWLGVTGGYSTLRVFQVSVQNTWSQLDPMELDPGE